MGERRVRVICHGKTKLISLKLNLSSVQGAIRQRFSIPEDSECTLTMILDNGTRCPLANEKNLQDKWSELKEVQVALSFETRRAMIDRNSLKILLDGMVYQVDEPPAVKSPLVQKYQSDGVVEKMTVFKNMCPKISSLVVELCDSVRGWKKSTQARSSTSNNFGSNLKVVVVSLSDMFEKSARTFGKLEKLCSSISTVFRHLSVELANNNHKAVVDALNMLMREGQKMDNVAGELNYSIVKFHKDIEAAVQAIENEKKVMEGEVEITTKEVQRTEDNVRRQVWEINLLEREKCELSAKMEKKGKQGIVGTAAGGSVGFAVTLLGIAFLPFLAVGGAITAGTAIYGGVTLGQISKLEKRIVEANETKNREERRKADLEVTLGKLRNELVKLKPIVDCLHEVWGQINRIRSTVIDMKSFWPGLKGFCTSMINSEKDLVSALEVDSNKHVPISDTTKTQIIKFLAKQV